MKIFLRRRELKCGQVIYILKIPMQTRMLFIVDHNNENTRAHHHHHYNWRSFWDVRNGHCSVQENIYLNILFCFGLLHQRESFQYMHAVGHFDWKSMNRQQPASLAQTPLSVTDCHDGGDGHYCCCCCCSKSGIPKCLHNHHRLYYAKREQRNMARTCVQQCLLHV